LATRGQADMRGLGTAGRVVRQERAGCLGSSVTLLGGWVAHSCVVGRSMRCYPGVVDEARSWGCLLLHDG
jgi:hypothetical protein